MYKRTPIFNKLNDKQAGVSRWLPLKPKELGIYMSTTLVMYLLLGNVLTKNILTIQVITQIIYFVLWVLWSMYMSDKPEYFFLSKYKYLIYKGKYEVRREEEEMNEI